jgi:hypothetical protein
MLSTGARRNPRGHHDHAGDRYWINSSAIASSVSGTSIPSALAVLRLMTNSYFVGAQQRRIAWQGRSFRSFPCATRGDRRVQTSLHEHWQR